MSHQINDMYRSVLSVSVVTLSGLISFIALKVTCNKKLWNDDTIIYTHIEIIIGLPGMSKKRFKFYF